MELKEPVTERRRQTRSNIYRHLYQNRDFCSKQSIAYDLGLSPPTVYQNLTELMEAGLICYSGEQRSTGGRRAMGLSIISDARIAIGISVTESRLRFVAADLRLQELAYRSIHCDLPVPFSDLGPTLARELEGFLDDNQLDRTRLLGIGIALPAVISPQNDRIIVAPTLCLRDTPLNGLIQSIPYPTFIQNDGTSGGYAEWFMRSNPKNMAYLSLENGVGGSVLIGGALYGGDHLRSGEFGHMCVEPGGLPCRCGKRGCLESYCSAHRLSDDLGITLKDFFDGLAQHNPEYETLWGDVLRHLAIGINNIHMALDCDVVLGGFLTRYLPPYLPLLKEHVAAGNTFSENADFLHLSILRQHSVPLGVALHFIVEFLSSV